MTLCLTMRRCAARMESRKVVRLRDTGTRVLTLTSTLRTREYCMGKPDVTVLTVLREGLDDVVTWLAHLEQQTFPAACFEVLVVDGCGAHPCCEIVRRYAEAAPMPIRCVRQESGGLAEARNLGLREAQGRWILFLDPDLLAGPGLVQAHAAAQERAGGAACVVGRITRHPQLPEGALTRWFLPEAWPHLLENAHPDFLDCPAHNLSLPRRPVLDMGAFAGGFGNSGFDDLELAWRLEQRGIAQCFAQDAPGYVWRNVPFEVEYRRQYERGYALPALMAATDPQRVRRRFPVAGNPFQRLADILVMPYYLRACLQAEEDVRIIGAIFRRTLRHAFRMGFHDAQKGRERKY